MSRSLILIGFKACGKTSVGRLLAEKRQAPFIDTDRVLEDYYGSSDQASQGMRCAQIYHALGAQRFRSLEKKVIADLQLQESSIIATGGGVVLDPDNMALLHQLGRVIYLSASYATLLSRLKAGPRPAFMQADLDAEFQALYASRERLYRNNADQIWDTEHHSVTEVVEHMLQQYG